EAIRESGKRFGPQNDLTVPTPLFPDRRWSLSFPWIPDDDDFVNLFRLQTAQKSRLPANPLIGHGRARAGSRCQIDKVDHNLFATQAAGKLLFLDFGSDNDNLAAANHFFQIGGK